MRNKHKQTSRCEFPSSHQLLNSDCAIKMQVDVIKVLLLASLSLDSAGFIREFFFIIILITLRRMMKAFNFDFAK